MWGIQRPSNAFLRVLFPVLLAGVWALAPVGATTPPPGGGTGIAGVVLDTGGSGISGAEVVAEAAEPGKVFLAVSGEHGVYSLSLPAGEYGLAVWLAGQKRVEKKAVLIRSGEIQVLDFEVELQFRGDSLEVTGPVNLDHMLRSELLETAGKDVAESLTELPGVWKLRKGGIANDVVLRGYQGENLNVLIDGIRVQGACPNNMDPPTFHVDLSEVDRAEVSRGPFDVKNVGSLGGVVNVVTRKPLDGFHGEVSVAGGSFGYFNPAGVLSYGGDRFSFNAGASYRSSDPYRDGEGERFTEVAEYKASAVDTAAYRVKAGWAGIYLSPTEKDHIRLSYARQEADHVLYPYLLMDGVSDNTDRFQLGYEHTPGWGGLEAFRVQAYSTHVVHWMDDALRTSSNGRPAGYGMGTYAETKAFGGRVEAQWPVVTFGAEYTRRDWDAQTRMAGMMYKPQYTLPGVEATTFGVYGLLDLPLSGGLALRGGARWDRFRSSADPRKANTDLYYAYHGTRNVLSENGGLGGNLRLHWTPIPTLELSAGVGSVQRYPDPQELFLALKRMGADWVGDPRLKPARNTGADVSLDYRWDGITVRATLFRDRVQDFITVYDQRRLNMVPGVMNPVAKSYANVDAVLKGGELSASVALWGRFFVHADAAYVRGTQDPRPEIGIRSDNMPEMPPLWGRAAARYDDGRFWAELEGVFSAAQDEVDTDLKEEPTPGWGICNLRLGLRWKGFSVTASANNLFDRYYVEHLSYQRDPFRSGVRVPEPGRNITLTVGWRY